MNRRWIVPGFAYKEARRGVPGELVVLSYPQNCLTSEIMWVH